MEAKEKIEVYVNVKNGSAFAGEAARNAVSHVPRMWLSETVMLAGRTPSGGTGTGSRPRLHKERNGDRMGTRIRKSGRDPPRSDGDGASRHIENIRKD